MSDIPRDCYDSLNKRYKCNLCSYCVSYTMGKSSFKKFNGHYVLCKLSKGKDPVKKQDYEMI